jgi:hypothetical protein
MGIGQKNMELTKINLLTVKETVKVYELDDLGKRCGSHLEEKVSTASLDLATGEIQVKEADGTGTAISIDPKLINLGKEWINNRFERANAREQERQAREATIDAQRLREAEARAREAELRLEEEQLRHEIRMTELRIELAQRRKQLREAEAEAPAE